MSMTQLINDSAVDYLIERITQSGTDGREVLNAYIAQPRIAPGKPALTKHLIHHSYNRQMGPNVIGKRITDAFHKLVFDYDPDQIYQQWGSNGGDGELYEELIRMEIAPPKRSEQRGGYWNGFCKSIVGVSSFVSQLDYDRFTIDVKANSLAKLGALQLIASEIHGYGIPLAADALKEAGIIDTVKPDTHIRKLGKLMGITFRTDTQLLVKINGFCDDAGISAYAFDKAVWLIYSNKFYKHEGRSFDVSSSEWESSVRELLALQ